MVDLKSMTSPQAALAVLIAMDDNARGTLLRGLGGIGSAAAAELDSTLAGLAGTSRRMQRGTQISRRIATFRQQIKPLAFARVGPRGGGFAKAPIYARTEANGLGSWLSEAIKGVTGVIGQVAPVVGPIIGAATGIPIIPGYAGGYAGQQPAPQQAYSQSWYARNDPTSGAASVVQNGASSMMDFGILAILSQMFGAKQSPLVIPQASTYPYAAAAAPATGTVFGMKPEIAALVGLGMVFLLTKGRE